MTTPTVQPEPREKSGIPKNPGRRDLGPPRDPGLPQPRDRRQVLRPDHLHRLPDLLLGAGPGSDLPARGRWRLRPAQDAEADQLGHRVRSRLDHRACRLHLRHQRRLAHPLAPARPASRRRRLRPAEPAVREVQGRGDDAPPLHRRGRSGAARSIRGAGRRGARAVRRPPRRPACRARTPASSSRTPPGRTWS